MDLQEAVARRVLRSLTSDELPAIAVEAVMSGRESPSLAALAGATRADSPADLWDLFSRSLTELAIAPPTRLEAAEYLKLLYARRVVTGALAPYDGAAGIVALMQEVERELPERGRYVGESFGVARLVGLYYSWGDVPSGDDASRRRIELALKQACGRLAEGVPDPVPDSLAL
jgi:hypothetical protein